MSIVPSPQPTRHANEFNGSGSVGNTLVGSLATSNTPTGTPQGFDIWGVLQRRKYLLALLCIVGAMLGYLNHIKTPPTYSSSTQLLIVTQAPPAIVDGNYRLEQQTSLAKHQSLLSSELVLGSAVNRGKLDTLHCFRGQHNVVDTLKKMMRVIPGQEDTLTLVCSGPDADELPKILNWVVEAYEFIIEDDSQNVSKQAVGLVEKLAIGISNDKDDAESDRQKLWEELDDRSISGAGVVVNQHSMRLGKLSALRNEFEQQLADIRGRTKQLLDGLKRDEESNEVNPLQIKLAAIEAREFLNLSRSEFASSEQAAEDENAASQKSVLTSRITRIDDSIFEIRSELKSKFGTVGAGHPDVDRIRSELDFYRRERNLATQALAQLETEAELETKSQWIDGEVASKITGEAEFRQNEDKEWIDMYRLSLQKKEESLTAKLTATNSQIESVSKKSAAVAKTILQLNVLQKKIDSKDREANVVLDRLKELNVLASNYTQTRVRTLDQPKMGVKIAPSFSKNIAIGSMLAFLVGMGLAVLIDQSELSFRNPEEIREGLKLPVVGKIPRIKNMKTKPAKGVASLVAAHRPSSTAAEAFRNTRTSLFFRANAEDIKTLMITSPSPGDGKSTTAANLAISIAQAGKRVILVDADLRRPRVDQYFGEELPRGLTDVLLGEMTLQEVVKPTELQNGLHLMTAGGRPSNPAEMVSSSEFRLLIAQLRKDYDFVVIDAPPVLPVSDPASVASAVDGVFLVMRIRKGVKITSRKAKETLDRVGANWLGVVINDIDQNQHYHEYGYQYGYGYSYYGKYYEAANKSYRDDARIESSTALRN